MNFIHVCNKCLIVDNINNIYYQQWTETIVDVINYIFEDGYRTAIVMAEGEGYPRGENCFLYVSIAILLIYRELVICYVL